MAGHKAAAQTFAVGVILGPPVLMGGIKLITWLLNTLGGAL